MKASGPITAAKIINVDYILSTRESPILPRCYPPACQLSLGRLCWQRKHHHHLHSPPLPPQSPFSIWFTSTPRCDSVYLCQNQSFYLSMANGYQHAILWLPCRPIYGLTQPPYCPFCLYNSSPNIRSTLVVDAIALHFHQWIYVRKHSGHQVRMNNKSFPSNTNWIEWINIMFWRDQFRGFGSVELSITLLLTAVSVLWPELWSYKI